MQTIHFQGLNCYHDCVISIANHLGLDYPAAFATLWSETDFRYDPYRVAYLSKRIISNLEALGARVENVSYCLEKKADERLNLFDEGELIIVGMDAFYIPWNQIYLTFNGPHYFIARYSRTGDFLCFDPTYGKTNEYIGRNAVTENIFDIIRVSKTAEKALPTEAAYEAREVLRALPDTRRLLLSHLYGCVTEERQNVILLAKYIDALINNRYLYRFFLENQAPPYKWMRLLFDDDYFWRWKAVKNGLYKASASRDRASVAGDVCEQLGRLLDDEAVMANKIIGGVSGDTAPS